MARYTVDVHDYTHTCPGNPQPHTVETVRTIVGHTPTGTCHTPVLIHVGARRVELPCARVRPAAQQCDGCRPSITVRTRTATHRGAYVSYGTPTPGGLAPDPCDVCHRPLAAALASGGCHILCHPYGDTR